MPRNPYAPPTAKRLELLGSDRPWSDVRILAPSLGAACIVTVGLFIVAIINSRQVPRISFFIPLFVSFWIAVALALVVGRLFRYLAQQSNIANAVVAALLGASVGGFAVLVIDFPMRRIPALAAAHVPPIAYLQFAVVGAVAGFVFWIIANRQLRPNSSLERMRGR